MASNDVILSAPMSFTGSAARLWKLTGLGATPWLQIVTIPLALLLVTLAWAAVTGWYLVFGVLMFPYRLIRRGQRKGRRDALRHQELLEAARRG